MKIHPGLSVAVCWLLLTLTQPGSGAVQVIDTVFPTEDVVIAVETVQPVQAGTDATPIIQQAIDAASSAGGGTVFLPAGRYELRSPLRLKEGVTLRGDWQNPARKGWEKGTLLAVYVGRGDPEGAPAITMPPGSGLREMTIWYPEQDPARLVPYSWTIRSDASREGNNITVMNTTLVNPWQAIKIGPEWNELHTIQRVFGTPLRCGIWVDTCTDIGRITGVDFRSDWWENAALPSAPSTASLKKTLRTALLQDATGVDIGRSDWEFVYALKVSGYANGLVFREGRLGASNAALYGCTLVNCGVGLRVDRLNHVGVVASGSRFTGRRYGVQTKEGFDSYLGLNDCELIGGESSLMQEGRGVLSLVQCRLGESVDPVAQIQGGRLQLLGCKFTGQPATHVFLAPYVLQARVIACSFDIKPSLITLSSKIDMQVDHSPRSIVKGDTAFHRSAAQPRPKTRQLILATDHGVTIEAEDNGPALQRALDAAGALGGGTVYIPAAHYRFRSNLTVPSGVELRGNFDVPHHTMSGGTVLMPEHGKGDESGTPFLSLQPGSGVRGLTVWYPDQNLLEPSPYPWTIRGLGPRCWVQDVVIGNGWQGVDFWTHPSDGHIVRYLAGCLLRKGVWVSKAKEGWLEDIQINPHYSFRLPKGLTGTDVSNVFETYFNYLRGTLDGIIVGRSEREHIRGTFVYAAKTGLGFTTDNGGPAARVIMHGSDTCVSPIRFDAAAPQGIEVHVPQMVPYAPYVRAGYDITETCAGPVRAFNGMIWGAGDTLHAAGTGKLLIQQLHSTVGDCRILNGEVTLEAPYLSRRSPAAAIQIAKEAKATVHDAMVPLPGN